MYVLQKVVSFNSWNDLALLMAPKIIWSFCRTEMHIIAPRLKTFWSQLDSSSKPKRFEEKCLGMYFKFGVDSLVK